MMHIGQHIRDVLEERGHNASWLADMIPCERSNVYNIFKRGSVGIGLLMRISEVLGHDFFADLSADLDCRLPAPAPADGASGMA